MDTTARNRLVQLAAESPKRPALIGFDTARQQISVSREEFAGRAVDLADRIAKQAAGLSGPPVAVVEASTDVDTVVCIVAAICANICVLPINVRAPVAERQRVIALASAHGAVCAIDEGHGLAPHPHAAGSREYERGYPLSYLMSTGGSSGGVHLVGTPGPFHYDARRLPNALMRKVGWRSDQRQLIVGALHHAAPYFTMIDGVWSGNVLVLQPVFSPNWTVRLIEEQAIEWIQLTPAYMRVILHKARPTAEALRSLRAVVHSSAACDHLTKRAWIELVGPCRLFEHYSMTEQIGATVVRGDEWLARPGTVGRGFLTKIKVLNEDRRPVPVGEVGRVYMRTSFLRVARRQVDIRSLDATVDGYFSVGDYGHVDGDGYLYLASRRTNMINVGGENVYPGEIEAVLMEHEQVSDVIVVAAPNDALGEAVQALVVRRNGATLAEEDLIHHCTGRLAAHKVPRDVVFVDHVPRSAAGKLERWRIGV